jgi:hypothetical protein
MRTNELLSMLKTAKQLGVKNVPIYVNNGRDGTDDYQEVKAVFETLPGINNESIIILVIR